MAWALTEDLADCIATAGEFLRSRPVRHTIQLSVVQTLLARGGFAFGETAPLFGWWRAPDGEITAALLHTPPYPVLLTPLPGEAAQPLAEALLARGRPLPGVNAEQSAAAAFAAAWSALTGASAHLARRSRLFRLGQLKPPAPLPPGAPRVATEADRTLLESWLAAFGEEINDVQRDPAEVIADRVSYGGLTLWESGGTAVSLAGLNRPADGVVRVGPVYTPREHRQRGYGGAVTTAVCRAALGAGAAEVVLFTDLANPTSNALYQRLGFLAVDDLTGLSFGP
jgi:RimJ/RimL family protein N-acetyltransferase